MKKRSANKVDGQSTCMGITKPNKQWAEGGYKKNYIIPCFSAVVQEFGSNFSCMDAPYVQPHKRINTLDYKEVVSYMHSQLSCNMYGFIYCMLFHHEAAHQGILFFHQLQEIQIVLAALVDLVDLKSLSLPPFQVHPWLPSHPLAQETPSHLCLPFSLKIGWLKQSRSKSFPVRPTAHLIYTWISW